MALRIVFGFALVDMEASQISRFRCARSRRATYIDNLLNLFQRHISRRSFVQLISNHHTMTPIAHGEIGNETALMDKSEDFVIWQLPGQAHIADGKALLECRPYEVEPQ